MNSRSQGIYAIEGELTPFRVSRVSPRCASAAPHFRARHPATVTYPGPIDVGSLVISNLVGT